MPEDVRGVSTKDLIRARRLAARRRAAVACARCKHAKVKCTDNRPCKKCANSNLECAEFTSERSKPRRTTSSDVQYNIEGRSTQSGNSDDVCFLLGRDLQRNVNPGDRIDSIASTGMSSDDLRKNKEKTIQRFHINSDQHQHTNSTYRAWTIVKKRNTVLEHRLDLLRSESESNQAPQNVVCNQWSMPSISHQGPPPDLPDKRLQPSMLCSSAFHDAAATVREPPASHSALPPTLAALLLCAALAPPPFLGGRPPLTTPYLFTPPSALLHLLPRL
jgi:hypothetical protein